MPEIMKRQYSEYARCHEVFSTLERAFDWWMGGKTHQFLHETQIMYRNGERVVFTHKSLSIYTIKSEANIQVYMLKRLL